MSAQDSERSPKRQRCSYSPASPPPAGATLDEKSSSVHQAPQTPPPSVHMSPSWTSQHLPGLQYSGSGNSNGNGSGSGSVTFPTPPSTAGFQSQMMGRGMSSEGERAGESDEGERGVKRKREDAEGDEDTTEPKRAAGDVTMAAVNNEADDAEHRRTDHERQQPEGGEEAHVSAANLPGAQVLYKLRAEPIARSAPHPSQNLFSLYDLHRIQSSVARRDPTTGEKINKLRKSYEGKIKDMGIEGRNKATKSQMILEGLVDPGWDMLDAGGSGRSNWSMSDFSDPRLPTDGQRWDEVVRLEGVLSKALELGSGRLPKQEHESWKNLLGLDDQTTAPLAASSTTAAAGAVKPLPAATAPTPVNAASPPIRNTTNPLLARTFPQASATSSAVRNASAPSSPRPLANGAPATGVRPERTGKKRRYDESSYAGYAEGYRDDEEEGYSTGGGPNERRGSGGGGGGRKQRRKESYASSNSATSPTFSTPAGGGGAGGSNNMVGVRSS